MEIYFGFGLESSMFPADCMLHKAALASEEFKEAAERGLLIPFLNPSDAATITAMKKRCGIDVPIPEKAPTVTLNVGDTVIVVEVRGLPHLAGRDEYTEAEVAEATFSFSAFTVVS